MKTITVDARSRAMKELLQFARKGDVILKASEGDEFLISAVDDFEIEIAKQRQSKKLMAFLDERFRRGREEKGIPLDEAFALRQMPGGRRKMNAKNTRRERPGKEKATRT